MKMMKAILTIALTLALTIALTTHFTQPDQTQEPDQQIQNVDEEPLVVPTKVPTAPRKRVSRFLADDKAKNPRAADHCRRDGDVCAATTNTYCCNNKCVNLHTDKNNCGRCKSKCKYTQSCCRGKCVNLSYDKRNCGYCGKKCAQFCIYGTCDYA